jgi:signal transduction histidine kinase
MLRSVYATGRATWSEDLRLFFARNRPREEVYVRFTFGPILAADGQSVEGIFCPCTETTEQVVGARRLETLRKLGARSAEARSLDAACEEAAAVLADDPRDIPFAALYRLDEREGRAARCASAGLLEGYPLPLFVPSDEEARPFDEALGRALRTHHAEEIATLVPPMPPRCGDAGIEPVQTAMVLPIPGAVHGSLAGLLLVGVSPHQVLDTGYRTFFDLVAGHIGTSLADAVAYDAERKRVAALAELDHAKTVFFSNISHEFRTPLTLLLGPLEDALAGLNRTLGGENLETAYRNALRLLRLVNALLDFARIEAGRARACFEPTELAPFTVELASVFRSAIEHAGLALLVRCDPLPEPVYVDRDAWEKIVLNLLSNALKFTFEGEIEVTLQASAGQSRLTVRDTGTGIAARELPRLFERFHRIEGVHARTHEGSGIGLALVHELVRMHGGEISVDSELDRGTTFSIALPFGTAHLAPESLGGRAPSTPTVIRGAFVEEALRWIPDQESVRAPASERRTRATSGYILFADDNADMREYVGRLLRERWIVETVSDGRAALDAARARKPALIITDVMMPRLDGIGLLHELRKDASTRSIPDIMLSARAGEEARIQGIEVGADDYLVKPFSARELMARVATRLELQQLGTRLAQERAAIADLFAKTPMPVAIWRGSSLVYDVVNPAYLAAIGGRDVRGKPLLEALPEIAGQGLDDLLRSVMRTGVAQVHREALLKLSRSGRLEDTYWTFISAPLQGEDGETDSVIVICNDVTEQVEARRRLERLAAEAHAANRAKDEFLAMLGHELRNPLSPIVTALHLLRLRGTRSREQDVIERQVTHLTRLVDDLLDVSRITRGKIDLKRERVEAAQIIAGAVELASPLFEGRQHRVDVSAPPWGLLLEGDPVRLTQIVSNLLTNAAKYTPASGQIGVTARRQGERIFLEDRDNGIGLAPDLLTRVFDLFVQGRQDLARSQGGLGLGLAIVKSLVTLHGGRVEAHSEGEGRGSTFIVDLPAADTESADQGAASQATGAPSREVPAKERRILIVDDNEDAAGLLAETLVLRGYTTRVAYDGPTALRIASEFHPDAALLDIGLPVMDGYELARRLREQPLLHQLPLIAVTGYGQEADHQRSSDAGFKAHLVKPVRFEVLEALLRRTVEGGE